MLPEAGDSSLRSLDGICYKRSLHERLNERVELIRIEETPRTICSEALIQFPHLALDQMLTLKVSVELGSPQAKDISVRRRNLSPVQQAQITEKGGIKSLR